MGAGIRTVASLVLLAACTFPAAQTPTPSPPAEPAASATPPPSVGATGAPPSASPTPDVGAIPAFSGREVITTTIAGLRVRQLPGIQTQVITDLLSFDAELEVIMGPLVVDELGWYLVRDADADAPEFEEGWVAAGFEPEANLRSTGRIAEDSPVIVALAQTGDAEHGPISIPDDRHIIRWAAVDPEGVRCQFSVSLAAGSGEPVPTIRSTVGPGVIPGTTQSSFFVSQPTLRGQLFLTAETDCAWTLAVLREELTLQPSATP